MSTDERFWAAVRSMHRHKDAAYKDAWKRRGEGISVLANIARKVDRLENVAKGGPITRDESHLDTAVDLLIYSLKYQTYLADMDSNVASLLFGTRRGPFSESVAGVESLLEDMFERGVVKRGPPKELARAVVDHFNELEARFRAPDSSVMERLEVAQILTKHAAQLTSTIAEASPEERAKFIELWGQGEN